MVNSNKTICQVYYKVLHLLILYCFIKNQSAVLNDCSFQTKHSKVLIFRIKDKRNTRRYSTVSKMCSQIQHTSISQKYYTTSNRERIYSMWKQKILIKNCQVPRDIQEAV